METDATSRSGKTLNMKSPKRKSKTTSKKTTRTSKTAPPIQQSETQTQDITNLDLARSLSLLRATLDATWDGILVVDRQGKIVSSNQQFASMWNIPSSILESRDDDRAIAYVLNQLKDPERFLRKVRELYGDPYAESHDVLEFHDGRVFERYSKPQLIAGEAVGRVWSFRDVTLERSAQEGLRESEDRYRRIVELSRYAISVSIDGKLQYINQAGIEGLAASSREELMGRDILDFVHPDFRTQAVSILDEMFRTGIPPNMFEHKLIRLDGVEIDVETAIIPFTFKNKPAAHIIVHNITDRKASEEHLRRSEERYRSLVKQSKEGVFIFDLVTKRIQEANDVFLSMLGYSEKELHELRLYDIVAIDRSSVDVTINKLMQKGQITIVPGQYLKKDRTLLDVEVRASLVSYGDSTVCLVNTTDLAERKKAQAIQSALYRIAEVMSSAQDMQDFYSAIHDIYSELTYAKNFYIALYDPSTQMLSFPYYIDEYDPPPPPTQLSKGLTEYVLRTEQPLLASPEKFEELVGRGEVESVGAPSLDWLGVPLKTGDKTFGVLVVQSYNPNIRFSEKDLEVLIFVSQHIASALERKQAAETIRHLAYHDSLTGLPNRMLFRDRFLHSLALAHRKKEMLAMLFLDLDRFKKINDTLGHAAGDRLLQAVAERLKKTLREYDTIARLGGDEFMILLSGVKAVEDAAKVAEKILQAIHPSFVIDGQELHITTSIGISLYPYDGQDTDTLLKNADIALYRAKDFGRNNYQLYTASMNARAFEQLAFENSLRRALEREELFLVYQPLVDMRTKAVTGLEALVRWKGANGQVHLPDTFIPLAEDTGLIVPMGEWILRTACRQLRAWQTQGLPMFPVAVNLSARQFQQENLISEISKALVENNLQPEYLSIEITESTILKNADLAIEALRELKSMGVQICIDDFGTGYSSLSYLKRFPVDTLKIDRSFVRDCMDNADDAAIVSAIISMAHSLKLIVVAEGVETDSQLEFLRTKNCDKLQGYLISPPLPSTQLSSFLTQWSASLTVKE
jgi:diguanylate cyclase (GGDEF)-like protein/PAS domain S-box-containing protein